MLDVKIFDEDGTPLLSKMCQAMSLSREDAHGSCPGKFCVMLAGPLTAQQTDLFMRNQRFAGLKFPDMQRPETLERRFANHLDAEAMSFLM